MGLGLNTRTLDAQGAKDRIRFLLEHFWRGDRKDMAESCGVSQSTLKTVLFKSPTFNQIHTVLAGIRKHNTISPLWLDRGEGHWKKVAGATMVFTPPSQEKIKLMSGDNIPIGDFADIIAERLALVEAVIAGDSSEDRPNISDPETEEDWEELERQTQPETAAEIPQPEMVVIESRPQEAVVIQTPPAPPEPPPLAVPSLPSLASLDLMREILTALDTNNKAVASLTSELKTIKQEMTADQLAYEVGLEKKFLTLPDCSYGQIWVRNSLS